MNLVGQIVYTPHCILAGCDDLHPPKGLAGQHFCRVAVGKEGRFGFLVAEPMMLWYEARFDLGKKSPVGAMWGADGESFSDVEGIVFRGGWYCGQFAK